MEAKVSPSLAGVVLRLSWLTQSTLIVTNHMGVLLSPSCPKIGSASAFDTAEPSLS